MSTEAGSRTRSATDHMVELVVRVGLAVFTWLAILLAIGFLARIPELSLLNVLPLFFVGLLFWPIYRAAPWQPGLASRVRQWSRDQQMEALAIAGLGLLPLVPFMQDVLVSLLQLSHRGSGVFFGASLFYRERFGSTVARVLLTFGQTYMQLLWLYFLSIGLLAVGRRLG